MEGECSGGSIKLPNSRSFIFPVARSREVVRLLNEFGLESIERGERVLLFTLVAQPTIITRIIEAQPTDPNWNEYRIRAKDPCSKEGWSICKNGGLCVNNQLYVPECMREEILKEAHCSRLAIHPGSTKMYYDVHR